MITKELEEEEEEKKKWNEKEGKEKDSPYSLEVQRFQDTNLLWLKPLASAQTPGGKKEKPWVFPK